MFPFDERENSYDSFRFIRNQTSYRFTNNTGFLAEKFDLMLRNFSFRVVDISYEGLVVK